MGVIAAALHQAKLLRESKMAALHQPGGVALVLVALHLPGGRLLLLVALYQPGDRLLLPAALHHPWGVVFLLNALHVLGVGQLLLAVLHQPCSETWMAVVVLPKMSHPVILIYGKVADSEAPPLLNVHVHWRSSAVAP